MSRLSVVLKSRPTGAPKPANFALVEQAIAAAGTWRGADADDFSLARPVYARADFRPGVLCGADSRGRRHDGRDGG